MLARLDDDEPLRCGRLEVSVQGSFARFGNAELAITYAQRLVLAQMILRAGKAWSRGDLYRAAFDVPLPLGSRAIDQHINELRRALGPRRIGIRSIARVGYLLDPSAFQ